MAGLNLRVVTDERVPPGTIIVMPPWPRDPTPAQVEAWRRRVGRIVGVVQCPG